MDADDSADFLAANADACAEAGVEPLPTDARAALANAKLTGTVVGAVAPYPLTRRSSQPQMNR